MRAEGEASVVGAGALGAEPAALEQRRDDVAPVADDVHGDRFGVRPERGAEHEAGLGCLLHPAQAAGEAEKAHPLEDSPQASSGRILRLVQELGNRRLPGLHLVQVDEAR